MQVGIDEENTTETVRGMRHYRNPSLTGIKLSLH